MFPLKRLYIFLFTVTFLVLQGSPLCADLEEEYYRDSLRVKIGSNETYKRFQNIQNLAVGKNHSHEQQELLEQQPQIPIAFFGDISIDAEKFYDTMAAEFRQQKEDIDLSGLCEYFSNSLKKIMLNENVIGDANHVAVISVKERPEDKFAYHHFLLVAFKGKLYVVDPTWRQLIHHSERRGKPMMLIISLDELTHDFIKRTNIKPKFVMTWDNGMRQNFALVEKLNQLIAGNNYGRKQQVDEKWQMTSVLGGSILDETRTKVNPKFIEWLGKQDKDKAVIVVATSREQFDLLKEQIDDDVWLKIVDCGTSSLNGIEDWRIMNGVTYGEAVNMFLDFGNMREFYNFSVDMLGPTTEYLNISNELAKGV